MHSGGSLGRGREGEGRGRGGVGGRRGFYSAIAEQGSQEDIAFGFCVWILLRGRERGCE